MAEKQTKKSEKTKVATKKAEKTKVAVKEATKKAEKSEVAVKEVSAKSFEVGQKVKTLDDNLEGEVLSVKVVSGILKKVKVKWENGMSYVVSPLSIK